jgi:hypothetical protein
MAVLFVLAWHARKKRAKQSLKWSVWTELWQFCLFLLGTLEKACQTEPKMECLDRAVAVLFVLAWHARKKRAKQSLKWNIWTQLQQVSKCVLSLSQ